MGIFSSNKAKPVTKVAGRIYRELVDLVKSHHKDHTLSSTEFDLRCVEAISQLDQMEKEVGLRLKSEQDPKLKKRLHEVYAHLNVRIESARNLLKVQMLTDISTLPEKTHIPMVAHTSLMPIAEARAAAALIVEPKAKAFADKQVKAVKDHNIAMLKEVVAVIVDRTKQLDNYLKKIDDDYKEIGALRRKLERASEKDKARIHQDIQCKVVSRELKMRHYDKKLAEHTMKVQRVCNAIVNSGMSHCCETPVMKAMKTMIDIRADMESRKPFTEMPAVVNAEKKVSVVAEAASDAIYVALPIFQKQELVYDIPHFDK